MTRYTREDHERDSKHLRGEPRAFFGTLTAGELLLLAIAAIVVAVLVGLVLGR